MFMLKTKQKVYEIGDFKIGGHPGELPTILMGNIFYKGMPEVSNHKEGNFDKKAVSKWIELAESLSEQSGVPHLLDLMAMYPKAISKYVIFVSEKTNTPFLIDGANPETRRAAVETVEQLALQKNVILNGITPKTSAEELAAIQDSGVKTAILMAYNELDYSPEGRVNILEDSEQQNGLLSMAGKAGIEKILVDTVVFDVPSISYAAEAVKLVKEKFGYPAGCSPANATYAWKQAVKDSVLRQGFGASNASAHTIVQCWGADFLIYGPIKQAKNIVPACAVNEAIIAYYAMKRCGVKPLVKNHPLYKIF
ncbi:MAG: tetrahydromethanopterin S-methyltransferase subunit H [Candidatus Bathyarchaeia archaeon]